MAQHDYVIANQGFPAFRSDLNDALAAVVSNNSGATEPTTMFAHQIWVDTAADPSVLKIRNADNDAWITIGTINQTNDTFKLTPAGGISTDTIAELTSAAGVTIDSVLLKDGGVTVSDGTVSAPTVTNTGDTNTGVYFPAADEVAIAAGGSVAAAFNSHQFMGMRNRIINGDMRIDQRNAGAAVTVDGASVFLVDRWGSQDATSGAFSAQQDSDAPAGFVKSLKITTTTADASISASEFSHINQKIEGTNISDLAWGTANAKTVTVSFWVRSSLTGTFSGALVNSAYNRSYPFNYTISVADTWQKKSIKIPGDTTGTWLTTTGVGITVYFNLGSGTDNTGTAGSWVGAGNVGADSTVAVIGTLNATWFVTGVQLEVGSVATPFERRPYTTELQLCQRYYWLLASGATKNIGAGMYNSSTQIQGTIQFPVTMRAAPTLSQVTGTDYYQIDRAGGVDSFNSFTIYAPSTMTTLIFNNSEVSGTGGQAGSLFTSNASSFLAFNAEL